MSSMRNLFNQRRGRGPPRNNPWLPATSPGQKVLVSISVAGLEETSAPPQPLKIQNVEYVASYNWVDENMSTILVPGRPPKWLPPAETQYLHEDSGQYFRDINSAHFPHHPLEPAVRAIYELNPQFNASAVDVFGCGNTIGGLLEFVKGEERTFRFGVERVGQTVFLIRKTNTPRELIDGVQGYGHAFSEAYMTWEQEVRGSSSHQRIISYDFAGLRCLVRSETDGYLPLESPTNDSETPQTNVTKIESQRSPTSSISFHQHMTLDGAISNLEVAYQQNSKSNELVIKQAGSPVDQNTIFDLKTRSSLRKNSIKFREFLSRLWVNQTPNFILAWHKLGYFGTIEVKDVRSDIASWEHENRETLVNFYRVLKQIVQLTQETDQSRLEIRRNMRGDLQVWTEAEGPSVLPSQLVAKWRGECHDNGKSDTANTGRFGDDDNDHDDHLNF